MSEAYQIFVAGATMEELRDAVVALLPDANLDELDDGGGLRFWTAFLIGDVRSHTFSNGEFAFEDYPLLLDFRDKKTNEAMALNLEEGFATALFSRLVSFGRFRLLFLRDLQTLRGCYEPRPPQP